MSGFFGANSGCGSGCNDNNCIWIILLLLCCGGCGGGVNICEILPLLLILSLCGEGFGGGCGCK
ncbi:MAG: chorion class high-cysteine HCB protein 13 [Clostridiales bacterium]|jgi:hypothetical protein|nr:chorion class high-cysteine HCB protein 13 [Clostridiales bacterium]